MTDYHHVAVVSIVSFAAALSIISFARTVWLEWELSRWCNRLESRLNHLSLSLELEEDSK